MKTELEKYFIRDLVKGFEYNSYWGKGLNGLDGNLVIQPDYQRNYIYHEEGREAGVIETLLSGHPLGLIYFNKLTDGSFEVLDGQQRITSIGRFVQDLFHINGKGGREQYYSGLPDDQKELLMNTKLLVYECSGEESEIKEWFETINIKGIPLSPQELLNAIFSGPFVSAGKAIFSNKESSRNKIWATYVDGNVARQEVWEKALEWASGGKDKIQAYLSKNRYEESVEDVEQHFEAVIAWVSSTFSSTHKLMRRVDWNDLYRRFGNTTYDSNQINSEVEELLIDEAVQNRKNVWEFVLGGSSDTKLLTVRVFEDITKRKAWTRQTTEAEQTGISNCPDCAIGAAANSSKIWQLDEMEADHVLAWSKGGKTSIENCQMLCSRHNKAKGNS